MAGLVEDSMSLSSVLVHVGMNELDNIVSDGSSENSGHWYAIYDFTLGIL
jgi:hypothetical protein